MLKTLTRLALILFASLLLLLAISLLVLQTRMANTFVENRLRAWIHPALQVNGDVSVSVLPRLGLGLGGVTIPSQQGPYPALSIRQLQFQVSWQSLFEGRLALQDFYAQGVDIFRSGPSWAPFMADMKRVPLLADDGLLGWVRGQHGAVASWHLLINQALIEEVTVKAVDSQVGELALATLGQLELKADVNWPTVQGSRATVRLRQLSVNQAEEFGYTPALLEQLGIANQGAWDVMALDSEWTFARFQSSPTINRELQLVSLTAHGAWGDLSATDGTVDLVSGQIAIPMQVTLTNAPTFKSRALQINVRQSRMRFELTGTLSEPGVQWLNKSSSSR